MTRQYVTNNINTGKFMSPNTFIKWLFDWLCCFKIDFCKHIDPRCRYNPKLLACDGTHIGVSVRSIMLDNGRVTGVDEPD